MILFLYLIPSFEVVKRAYCFALVHPSICHCLYVILLSSLIYLEPCMLGFWNFEYALLIKNSWPVCLAHLSKCSGWAIVVTLCLSSVIVCRQQLDFSSPELCSGWAVVITFCPSSVRPLTFWNDSWSHWANFAQISCGASLGWGNLS